MDQKHLFKEEDLISQSGDKTVTLTNRRIRYTINNNITSIMLEKISSIEVRYISFPLMLLAAALCAIAGFLLGREEVIFITGITMAILFTIIYFITRKHVVSISSDGGGKINFQTRGMNSDTLFDFINKIELAKSMLLSNNKDTL